MRKNIEIELRSEEVQDILTGIPHWMIRWGNILIITLLILLFVGSWLIKYPEIIKSEIIITSSIPPEKLIARSSGRIEKIFVEDQTIVLKGSALCVIENSANYNDVFLLKSILDTIDIENNEFPFALLKGSQLGEIEHNFADFEKEYSSQELNKRLQPFKIESSSKNYESIQLKNRLNLLHSQKSINENELLLQSKELDRYETLFSKGIIAAQEIEKQRLHYLQAEKNYISLLSLISQLKSTINEMNLSAKINSISEDKENVILGQNVKQSFYLLKKSVKDWDLNFILRSSNSGIVSYLQIWKENQTVKDGDYIFSVIPSAIKKYVGKVKAIAHSSGKIEIGQDVIIKLSNFPYAEYGIIQGKVKSVSLVPDNEGNLFIDISLTNGLKTSYNKTLPFQQEMHGSAEIITNDLRLLQRIFYQFTNIFNR